MKKENCVPPIISHPQEWGLSFLMRRLSLALSLFVLVSQTAAAVAGQEEAPANLPELTPAAVISFGYPSTSPWMLNRLAVLTPDGRSLIDGASIGRYLQVWDWKKNKVVKRLLLNENAPEPENDVRPNMPGMDAEALRGIEPGWAFSPDGKYFAVCTELNPMSVGDKIVVRVWNIEQGTVVANIKAMLADETLPPNVLGQDDRGAVMWISCKSLSFSPNGKRLAVFGGEGSFYANRERFAAWKQDGKVYSILYDTMTWQPTAALRNPDILENAVSPGLYDRADGKTIFMLLMRRPGFIIAEKLGTKGLPTPEQSDPYVKKRLVTFDANTGQIVKSMELPGMPSRMLGSISEGVGGGVKWSWLGASGKEVYWSLDNYSTLGQIPNCDNNEMAMQFFSEVTADCDYIWRDAILDVETGKMRFMTPIKKLYQSQYDKWAVVAANSWVAPNGKLMMLSTTQTRVSSKTDRNGMRSSEAMGTVDLYAYPALRLIGTLKSPYRFKMRTAGYDNDSRFIILSVPLLNEATVYDLSRITKAQ